MTRIPGVLDTAALARMHFHALSRQEQAQAIRRLAASGQGEHTIALATGLSVEQIRRILAEAERCQRGDEDLAQGCPGAEC
jgi:DNA invertase Pin-like site-specific DNA recombinase